MKKQAFIKKIILTLTLVSTIIFSSCTNEGDFTTEGSDILQAVVVKPEFTSGQTLYAGQTIPVGKVVVNIVDNNLTVTYNILADGWELTEAQMWVGHTRLGYPQTKNGNPQIGHFPYNAGNITGLKTYTFTKPLSELGVTDVDNCADFSLYFATHASVRKVGSTGTVLQTETAWGAGYRFIDRGSWATGFSIDFSCVKEITTTSSDKHETAFAYGGDANSFLKIDADADGVFDFNRWGWYVGPISQGQVMEVPVYAGAGQSDITKGTNVGTLKITYTGSTVELVFNMVGPYNITEAQFYVGSAILPTKNGEFTVAPGQYPHVNDDLDHVKIYSHTFTNVVPNADGKIFVVAHAVVYGF